MFIDFLVHFPVFSKHVWPGPRGQTFGGAIVRLWQLLKRYQETKRHLKPIGKKHVQQNTNSSISSIMFYLFRDFTRTAWYLLVFSSKGFQKTLCKRPLIQCRQGAWCRPGPASKLWLSRDTWAIMLKRCKKANNGEHNWNGDIWRYTVNQNIMKY